MLLQLLGELWVLNSIMSNGAQMALFVIFNTIQAYDNDCCNCSYTTTVRCATSSTSSPLDSYSGSTLAN